MNQSVAFVTVHEQPFPLLHYYSPLDMFSEASAAYLTYLWNNSVV